MNGPMPYRALIDIFDEVAQRSGESTAVVSPDSKASYAELCARSLELAHAFRAAQVEEGDRVAVMLPRGFQAIASILAILRCGASIAPLDPSMPGQRRETVLEILQPKIVIDTAKLSELDGARDIRVIGSDLFPAANPFDPAFVFFTSGSTGRPKGVEVSQVGISLLMHDPDFVPCGPGTCMAHISNPAFDALSFDLWAALLNGGSVAVYNAEEALDPTGFAKRTALSGANTAFLTSSLFNLLVEQAPDTLGAMDHLVVGGEVFDHARVRRLFEQVPGARVKLYNGYGPTEFATFAISHPVERERLADYQREGAIPIGRPLRGTHVLIDSVGDNPDEGELLLAGPRMALGYLNDRAETSRHFRHIEHEGRQLRVYATGDRVRRNARGEIIFLRRMDNQVKIRGHRVEIGDVEHNITRLSHVSNCVVLPGLAPDGTVALHAFVEVAFGADVKQIRASLEQRVPQYMVPARFYECTPLPLNANGKVDRQQLQARIAEAQDPSPAERTEGILAILAASFTLHTGVNPQLELSFVAAGGSSLSAVRVAADLADRFGIDFTFARLLAAPSLRQAARDVAAAFPCAEKQSIDPCAPYRASSEQERLFFLRRMAPHSDAYNAMFRFAVPPLSLDALRAGLQYAQSSNPLLSARMALEGDLLIRPEPGLEVPLFVIDAQEAESARLAAEPFDPGLPGMWRAIYDRSPQGGWLWLSIDHLAIDSAALEPLLRDIADGYCAMAAGEALPAKARVGHADYTRSRDHQRQGVDYYEHKDLWREALRGGTARDPLREAVEAHRYPRPGEHRRAVLAGPAHAALADFSTHHGSTLFTTLLALWADSLSAVMGGKEFAVGFPVMRRTGPEHFAAVGLYAETTIANIRCGTDVVETQRCVQQEMSAVLERQSVSYADIVGLARREKVDTGFGSMVVLEELALDALELEGVACQGEVVFGSEVKCPATLFARPDARTGEMILDLEYDPAVVDSERANEILEELVRRARAIPRRIASSEARPALADLLGLAMPAGDLPAIIEADVTWDYSRLRDEVVLRARVIATATRPGDRLAVIGNSSASLLAWILAAIHTGRAYVPLDAGLPQNRLATMVREANLRHAVCAATDRELANALSLTVLDSEGPAGQSHESAVNPDDAREAYVLFTSGSTGIPKGVIVSRHALANYIDFAARRYFGHAQSGVVATPLTFDATITTLLVPLCKGASVEILAPGALAVPQMAQLLSGPEPKVFKLTPAHLAILARYLQAVAPASAPHMLVVGGEVLEEVILHQFFERCPQAIVINEYGPTETTVGCSWQAIDRFGAETISIGRPIDNMQMRIVSDKLEELAEGETGEILVFGPGVAEGYLRAGDDAGRFVTTNIGSVTVRAFRTGDLGRYEGEVFHFCGRRDSMVKIRGYRIEPGEIEAVASALEGVEQAVVCMRSDHAGDHELVAYIKAGAAYDDVRLRDHLSRHLPSYMLPREIICVDAFPLTPHGKVDRPALLARDIDPQYLEQDRISG